MRRLVLAALTALAAIGCIAAVPTTSGAWTAGVQNTDATGASLWYSCSAAYSALAASAVFQWALTEPATASAAVDGGGVNGTYRGSRATASIGSPGGCGREATESALLDGSTSFVGSGATSLPSSFPTAFSIAGWVRTPAGWSGGGDVVMMCSSTMTASTCGSRDYRLYLTGGGAAVFGVATQAGNTLTVRSAAAVNDGAWHHLAGTLSGTTGAHLYIDGADVTSTATAAETSTTNGPVTTQPTTAAAITTSRSVTSGYWRVGTGDGNANWPGHNPFDNRNVFIYLRAQLSGVAVYKAVLSDQQVGSLAAAGR